MLSEKSKEMRQEMSEEKNLLILGAGRGQVGLINSARKAGYHTVVVSIPGNYPGFRYADETEYCDINDKEGVLQIAKKYQVVGVATCCIDFVLPTQGYVNDKMNLKGLSYKIAERSVNKSLMKDVLAKRGIRTPKHTRVVNESEARRAAEELRLPVMVKAVDLAGGVGLHIARNPDEAAEAFRKSIEASSKDYCIVEEFIDGELIGCNAFVADGEILFVQPAGDVTVERDGVVIPAGHYLPLELNEKLSADIDSQVRMAIEAMEFDNCAVNADLIVKDNEAYLIEITGRMGANCLPELASIYYGVDVYQLIAEVAAGDYRRENYEQLKSEKGRACLAEMIVPEKPGVIKTISKDITNGEGISQITFFKEAGDTANQVASTGDYIGQIITYGESMDDCRKYMEDAYSYVNIVIEETVRKSL